MDKVKHYWLEKVEESDGGENLVPWTFEPPWGPPKDEFDTWFKREDFIHVIEYSAYAEVLELLEDLWVILPNSLVGHHDLIARVKALVGEK